ncbi:MAG: NADH-quinone oxidoreductase subunit J [Solimonas sp.]
MTFPVTNLFFYFAALIAVVSTLFVITGKNPVHALLNLVVSLLAVSGMFFMLGAPFAGVLEVIVYAGAIMVLFVFVVMMLNLGRATIEQERHWLTPKNWVAPALLSGLLLAGLLYVIGGSGLHAAALAGIDAKQVGIVLFGPYLLAVELASMLLLAALVAAYHLGKHD